MSTGSLDVLVCGGGIAGCSVVWQAARLGLDVGLIDVPRPDSSSRVAAGLVTPITGAKLALTWRWSEFYPVADQLYRWAESQCDSRFWDVHDAYRVFGSREEADRFATRWLTHEGMMQQQRDGVRLQPVAPGTMAPIRAPHGGLVMGPAARLLTESYLDATAAFLQSRGRYWPIAWDAESDLQLGAETISIPSLQLRCNSLFLCQGFDARANRWFSELPLHPARGDILRLQSQLLLPDKVIHADAWTVPLSSSEILLGATYDREHLNTDVSHAVAHRWRQTLLARWQEMTGETIEETDPTSASEACVLQHRAAVRPASYDRHPLIGRHPQHPNLLCLNGLGSKGSLMAPLLAAHLLDAALHHGTIDRQLDWQRRR
ncbi:MAG: NAD(P)/FAD-dependent oxidoreductase [Pirellula sp.]